METPPKVQDTLTPAQRQAVAARGNVLVMAGAGTGKTKTLVERCLDCLERDGAQIDELLIVTFTEAAAAEMRDRLRRAIESKAQLQAAATLEQSEAASQAADSFWREQLARFDFAHVGTLHSFCLKLVREHFYQLGLDPRLAILDEGEARQVANEILDAQFDAHYAGDDEFSQSVQELIHVHGGGRDESIRQLVLRLHHYSQARPDAASWLARQRETFSAVEPTEWQRWLLSAIGGWCAEWLPVLEDFRPENVKAAEVADLLAQLPRDCSREAAAELLDRIAATDQREHYPKGKMTVLRKPLEELFSGAAFLRSLATVKNGRDPLAEDWSWAHRQMETLLRLAQEFAAKLEERKRADGVVDFQDLEQFALQLLWDASTGEPSAIAASWRQKLKFVFVDEYQDINAAQDKIIGGLARNASAQASVAGEAAVPNRFLVGDVKQSIYRFRLADPRIFRNYARDWRGGAGQTIPLSENFRSREGLLHFVNSLFRRIMREQVGGVTYDVDAELKFGSAETRQNLAMASDTAPRAELLVRFKKDGNGNGDEEGELAGLDDAQREARLVAWRLKQLISEKWRVFDDKTKTERPVEWRDMAILLRSPRGKSEIFAKEFERAGVPLSVARGGFYESAEILDLLSLLQLLDNPLQDVPCIAVLRSPLAGLSLDELAEIRLAAKSHFWTALNRAAECGLRNAESTAKVTQFLSRFSRWRKLIKQVSLSQGLEEILAETLYADWLRAQPRGAQRAANVTSFLHLAQQFDQFQRQGLFRFLKFIEAQQEAEVEPEVPAVATENAVRLMSIHQSKGLEFPVVVLADLAKRFNEQDLRGEIIFDEEFGLCPRVKPPQTGRRYSSLTHWLAQRRQRRELRGEELRLLYVAMTRARDNLILAASVTEKNWEQKWQQPQPATPHKIAAARCFADWLALWGSECGVGNQREGLLPGLSWRIMADAELGSLEAGPQAVTAGHSSEPPDSSSDEELNRLRARLEWQYPFQAAIRRKAKSSVTALRREAEELDEEADRVLAETWKGDKPHGPSEAPARNGLPSQPVSVRASIRSGGTLTAAQVGAAHHAFIQHLALDKVGDLAAEADRLVQENYLSANERAVLDLKALAAFWRSGFGKDILQHADQVRRELPFTARFTPIEIAAITGVGADAGLEQEFVVIQGVADLVVLRS
ncbi:MAG TPA: UvrD-helicase domain-containing protein, partial [Verrucomicrobiae bacterium]